MPFRLIRFVLLAAATLFAASGCNPPPPGITPKPAAAGAYPFRSATFTADFRWSTGAGAISSRYWIAPEGILKEVTQGGRVSFVLRHGGRTYEWDAGSHVGKQGISSGLPRLTGEPDALELLQLLPESFKPGNFRWAGYEDVEGMRTAKYDIRFRNKLLHAVLEGTVWLLPDRPFPVKYVNRGFGGAYEIVNRRLVFDSPVAPEYFLPPPDVRFKSVDIYLKK